MQRYPYPGLLKNSFSTVNFRDFANRRNFITMKIFGSFKQPSTTLQYVLVYSCISCTVKTSVTWCV